MKILFLSFFFSLGSLGSYEQDLKNTEWIKIKAERLDGSKIIDRHEPEDASLQYFFIADSVMISTDHQYFNKRNYSIQEKILTIGSNARYKIDSIGDIFFVISQLSNNSAPDNKLNRYYLINAYYLYDYLKKNNSLQIEGDTLAICDNQFSPTYMGDFTRLFSNKFNTYDVLKSAEGSFSLAPDGVVKEVNIDENKYFTTKEIKKIKEIFYASSGSWLLPPSPASLSYKMKFSLRMTSNNSGGEIIYYNLFTPHSETLNRKQQDEETRDFDKGAKSFNNKKFEEAARDFNKCIDIDSLDVDAYYNLATCYQKLGDKEKACATWKKLKEMGQKNGEILYDQSCQ